MMTFFNRKNTVHTLWGLALLVVITVLFLPVFLSVFSAHTDGLFILTGKGRWLGDPEGGIWFMEGRPLGALINSVLGWFTYTAQDLTWLRIASFGLVLISSRLIYLISRRGEVEVLWSYWLAFAFILLPTNLVNIVWVASGINGNLGTLLSITSYFLLYHSKPRSFVLRAFLAAVCFLTGLLIYQSTVLIVFALIFIKVLWGSPENWASARIKILQEAFFYCFLMAIYWGLVKLAVLPLGEHVLGLIPTTFSTYKMEFAGSIAAKMPLIRDTLRYGFIGSWDILLYDHPFLEWLVVAVSWAAGCGMIFLLKCRGPLQASSVGRFFQKLFFFLILFFGANAPEIMAVNCKAVIGYRTLLPASFMGLLAISYFFRCCRSSVKDGWAKMAINGLIIIYSFAASMVDSWAIDQYVSNNVKTYLYVDNLASRIDYRNVEKVYLRYSSPIWLAYPLPFEMGYLPVGLNYIFNKYSSLMGRSVQVNEVYSAWPLYFDKYTQVIDFEFTSNKKLWDEKRIYVYPTAMVEQKILLTEDFSGLEKYPTLNFSQSMGDGKVIPDWKIPPLVPYAFIYVYFIGPPQSLYAYRINARCINAQGVASLFALKWQGLDGHKQWVDISEVTPAFGETSVSRIVNSPAFGHIRLVLIKRAPSDALTVKELQFISH